MQNWFFLESDENTRIRNFTGDSIDNDNDVDEDKSSIYPPRNWLFKVQAPDLRPGETICVTGDVLELGRWIPEKCVPLKMTDPNIWLNTIDIPSKQRVRYRYCICVIVESEVDVIIRSWETRITPRIINENQISPTVNDDPDIYGTYFDETQVDNGWLSKGMILQLKLYKMPFTLFRPKYINRKVYIKMTPVNLSHHCPSLAKALESFEESSSADNQDIEKPKFSYTEIASLNDTDPPFKDQRQFGERFKENDMLIFQCYTLIPSTTAYLIDLYIYNSKSVDDEPPYHAGFSYLLPSALQGSEGSLVLPLTSVKQRPLGELRLQYLVVHPMPNITCDLSISYALHWKKSQQGLDVGHRGSGSSFKIETKNCSEIRENTIASLKTAVDHGADMVEFDVQLSKDLVPVIYHDFHVCIAMKVKKDITEDDMFELPLKELTYDQLKMLKVYHLTEGKTKNPKFFDENLEEHQPFPTLKSALECVSPDCGFNIELKWNMKRIDGSYELNDPLDLNLYVDTILEVVFKYAGKRRIIFSCFNPDVCTAIRYKQNKYPVMFLTQGETTKYQQYDDPRCWTIKAAISFVKMTQILGVNAHTEDIVRDTSVVGLTRSAGVVLFCWGDDNADPSTIQYLKDLGLHGIIYDKIYQYLNKDLKESLYLMEARESQKELIRMVASTTEKPQPATCLKQKIVNVNKMRVEENVSTATSLQSLESGN